MDIFNNDEDEGGERIPHGMPILDNVCFFCFKLTVLQEINFMKPTIKKKNKGTKFDDDLFDFE